MAKREGAIQRIRKTLPIKRLRTLSFLLAGFLFVALMLSIFLFGHAYNSLREAIQVERADYVQEISQQIITCQQFMEQEYSDAIINYAGIIDHAEIQSLADVHALLSSKDAHNILLVTASGRINDLNGAAVYLSNRQLMANLPKDGEVVQLFTSLNYADDYWLFVARIDPLLCEGAEYITAILAVPADEFRDKLSVSLFDGRGASYIVENDGSIGIKPENSNLAFDGYNLFSSMLQAGARKADVSLLENGMRNSAEGSFLFDIGGEDWLISHSAIEETSSIVVAIPLTVTAVHTYEGLDRTILFATATILSLAGIALLLVLFFFYRDRQRSREAMATAAKNDFLAKMSHDIRTPLNAVIGLELLAKDCSDNQQVKEYLRQSTAAANYLLSIINDVLDMTRIERGKLDLAQLPFDMNELVTDVKNIASSMAEEKNLQFEVELDSPFETTYLGDTVRIKQIMMNLLSNAMKFTMDGGRVGLRVAHASEADGCDRVTMTISDTGIGMSEDYLSRIFTPFEQEHSSYTQQYAGSGLGLSIVHNLVTIMKGTISVESSEGVGSCFTVVLPFVRGARIVPAEQRARPKPSAAYPDCRVLLAEDNTVNQQIAVSLLKKRFGITADVASDGQEAVRMFSASREGFYRLILMDVKMPVLDGLEATRQIRALSRPDATRIPIVALSANAFEEDIALSLAAGMNDHLPKPIDVAALGSVLNKYLRKDEDGS